MYTPRQHDIIGAAIRIIAEKGIQELTIRSLAEQVGVSEPALYRHFRNKSAILQGILDFFRDRSAEIFEAILSREPEGEPQVAAVIHRHCRHLAKNPAFSVVMFSEALFQDESELIPRVRTLMDTARESITRIMTRGMASGALRRDIPTQEAVLILMGALRLLATRWYMSGYSFDLVTEGDSLAASLTTLFRAQKMEESHERR